MTIQELLGPNGLLCCAEDENGNVEVLWGGRVFYSFNRQDAFARKLGIALLGKLGVLKKTISEIFAVERRTVRNVITLYQEEGIEGLRDHRQGPQAVARELKAFVINKYVELDGQWGYQQEILRAVEQKVEEGLFSKGISRSMLQKTVREHKSAMQQQRQQESRKETEGQRREDQRRHREQEGRAERLRGEQEEREQLKLPEGEQECVQHGGAAAAIPLLGSFGVQGFLPQGQGEPQRLFGDTELAVSYAVLNAGELVEVEQDFKLLASYQMGGIIGRVKLPSLSLYRQRIAPLVAQMDMAEVMVQASRRAHELLGFSRLLYIDGHFMPYYGDSATLYGYNPQRRLAMHGREYYFVHDEQGLPVYATISDGYRDMRHYLEGVDRKLRQIYGVGEKELTEVFDRGGYSKSFCVGIAGKIRFICWRSDAREVPRIPEGEWVEVMVQRQPNCYGEQKLKGLEAWERQREFAVEGKKARFRELWIKDGRKVSPALSNDFQRSLPELVAALTRRWGAQENMFKELKEHGIDRIHSYRKEEYTEEFLYAAGLEDEEQGVCHEIGNPKIRLLNRQIARLRAEKRRLAERIGRLEKAGKEEQTKGLRRKAAAIGRKITCRTNKRARLPKKVRMMDRIEQEKIVRLSDAKKLFFDWLKMNGIWAKSKLVEIVTPYYKDLRDVNKFVRSLLRSRTYVRRDGGALHVSFPPQRSTNAGRALQAVCEHLNTLKRIDLDLRFSAIDFRVGQKH
jgi:hypothetical protein